MCNQSLRIFETVKHIYFFGGGELFDLFFIFAAYAVSAAAAATTADAAADIANAADTATAAAVTEQWRSSRMCGRQICEYCTQIKSRRRLTVRGEQSFVNDYKETER